MRTQNGTLVNGTKDEHMRSPGDFILTHTHVSNLVGPLQNVVHFALGVILTTSGVRLTLNYCSVQQRVCGTYTSLENACRRWYSFKAGHAKVVMSRTQSLDNAVSELKTAVYCSFRGVS